MKRLTAYQIELEKLDHFDPCSSGLGRDFGLGFSCDLFSGFARIRHVARGGRVSLAWRTIYEGLAIQGYTPKGRDEAEDQDKFD